MLNSSAALSVLAAAEAAGGGLQDLLKLEPTLLWATIVVFVLFALVLGKFAWGPLLKIVDEREKTIREQVDVGRARGRRGPRAAGEAPGAAAQRRPRAGRDPGQGGEGGRGRARRAASPRPAARPRPWWRARASSSGAKRPRRSRSCASQVADLAVEAASRIVRSSLSGDAQRRLVDDYIRSLPGSRAGGRA